MLKFITKSILIYLLFLSYTYANIINVFEFTAEESCGKCFPGRLGSYRGKEMFDQVKNKSAKIPLKLLNELLVTMKKGCLCALCGAIPTPIMNILKYFGDEMKGDIV